MTKAALVHNKPHIYMLVGYPGSGKSTFRDNLEWKHSGDDRKMVILSSDDYVENIAKTQGKTYNEAWNDQNKNATKAMNLLRAEALKNKDNIIWDQMNLTKGTRRKKLSQVPDDYYKVAVYFDTEWNKLEEINAIRKDHGRAIPDGVFNNLLAEPPEKSEGFDLIVVLKR